MPVLQADREVNPQGKKQLGSNNPFENKGLALKYHAHCTKPVKEKKNK